MLPQDLEDRGVLHLATRGEATTCFELLLRLQAEQAKPEAIDQWGMTPLHWACFNGSTVHLHLLCGKLRVRIMVGDKEGKLPSHWAASTGNVECFRTLLNYWNDPELRNENEVSSSVKLSKAFLAVSCCIYAVKLLQHNPCATCFIQAVSHSSFPLFLHSVK